MSERGAKSATMRVKLRYATVDQFLVKYGPNISRGGVFIATKSPKAVGTPIRFEFILVNGDVEVSVLRGEGTVHFVRDATTAPGKASGMGVKFTKLYDEGQALIDRALRLKAASTETPPPPSDLPQGVREVTGEVELQSGSHPAIESPTPPDVPTPSEPPNVPMAPVDTAPMDMPTERVVLLPAEPPPADVPPPDVTAVTAALPRGPDVDALLAESGVDAARVNALLDRRSRPRVDASDEALEALRERGPADATTAAEAVARLDALLRRG